jgi:hypothetical protein
MYPSVVEQHRRGSDGKNRPRPIRVPGRFARGLSGFQLHAHLGELKLIRVNVWIEHPEDIP